jgi:hypothetical protein
MNLRLTKISIRNGLRLVSLLLLLMCANCMAVILHPNGEPAADFSDISIPDPNVVGRWKGTSPYSECPDGYNASCVVVAPNYVITTTHQGIRSDTTVQVNGVTYSIDEYWTHPNDPDSGGKVEIRLAKLRAAHLPNHVDIYAGTSETVISDAVVGGYGVGRGTDITKTMPSGEEIVIGYNWDYTFWSTIQRWGTNQFDSILDNQVWTDQDGNPVYELDVLIMDFDGPGETPFEAALGEHDSGGGWFLWDDDNKWKVAAITFGVERASAKVSHFLSESTANRDKYDPDPDELLGIRLSKYLDFFDTNMTDVCTEIVINDLNGDCIVGIDDLLLLCSQWLNTDCTRDNNYCDGIDIDHSGEVGFEDFAEISADWQNDYSPQ